MSDTPNTFPLLAACPNTPTGIPSTISPLTSNQPFKPLGTELKLNGTLVNSLDWFWFWFRNFLKEPNHLVCYLA